MTAGNPHLAARLAGLFRSQQQSDCELAFVCEGDLQVAPLLTIPAHRFVLCNTTEYLEVLERNKWRAQVSLYSASVSLRHMHARAFD